MDVLIEAPGKVVLRDQCVIPSPRSGQALVEVCRVSLCGSDYRLFEGSYAGPRCYPIRFGHEWAGRILDLGPGSRLDRLAWVTGDCSIWCGECDRCQVDRNLCRAIEKFGITRDGFSAQYRLVPERYLYQDDAAMDSRLLALTEIFAVAAKAIQRAEHDLVDAHEVLIAGAGPLGLAIYLLLRYEYSLPQVHMLESDPRKILGVKQWMPDCSFVEAAPWDINASFTYAQLETFSRYAVTFECAGSAAALNHALLLADKGGLVVSLGLMPPSALRTDLLTTKALRLQGSIGGTGAFPQAMKFLQREGGRALHMVTHEYPMQDAQHAFEKTMCCPGRIKAQLFFPTTTKLGKSSDRTGREMSGALSNSPEGVS
jgi:L-gulonate 5-dehydrogenase